MKIFEDSDSDQKNGRRSDDPRTRLSAVHCFHSPGNEVDEKHIEKLVYHESSSDRRSATIQRILTEPNLSVTLGVSGLSITTMKGRETRVLRAVDAEICRLPR